MSTTEASHYRFDRYEVRPSQRLVLCDGQPVALGGRAFDLLLTLIEERDRLLSQDELFARVWPGLVVDESNLRQHVSNIRKLLGSATVVTVAGRGYRFGAQLISADAPSPSHSLPSSAGLPGLAGSLASQAAQAGQPIPLAQAAPVLVRRVDRRPANKPTLIGREDDLQAVLGLLSKTHLLSLVGSGGVGKTRMALEVSDKLEAQFEHGICYVELAPVSNPAMVTTTVASALNIHEEPNRALMDTLLDYLRQRSVLLILDNCEHLIDSCALLAEQVLNCSAGTRILATSREALKVFGEVAWRLPSLRTAPTDATLSCEDLVGFAANRLFLARVQAVCPTFVLTEQNVAAVALICQQLDGIPLAIELAAARVGSIPLEQLASGLQDRFALLTNSRRTTLLRHQTLRSLIDWSHDLLSASERTLLRRLSQFAGGWTLDAAQDVCSAYPIERDDVLELLTLLVDKSLVVLDAQATPPRYRMLETVRQYGAEKLVQADELEAVRRRHLDFFMAFAEGLQPQLYRSDQMLGHKRANAELDNLLQDLQWALHMCAPEPGLRLFSALYRFWHRKGLHNEMANWQEHLVDAHRNQGLTPSIHYARSFYVAGMLATIVDSTRGRRLSETCLEVSRALEFDEGIAWALQWMGFIDKRRGAPTTRELFEQALLHCGRIKDPWRQTVALAQTWYTYVHYETCNQEYTLVDAKVAQLEIECAKAGGDPMLIETCNYCVLAYAALRLGQLEKANDLYIRSWEYFFKLGFQQEMLGILEMRGVLALRMGNPTAAIEFFRQNLYVRQTLPVSKMVTERLTELMVSFALGQHWRSSARLAGHLAQGCSPDEDIRTALNEAEVDDISQTEYANAIDASLAALGPDQFDIEVSTGRAMSREDTIKFALVCQG